jgi:phenylalanyl-tRNA synthetase beta chain
MRFCWRWLKEFIDLSSPGSEQEVCDRLAAAGVPVDAITKLHTLTEDAWVLDIDITPNRGDLLNHFGMAREIAAFSGRRLRPLICRVVEKGPDVGTLARVSIEDSSTCRRFSARIIQGVQVAPSPEWLQERLRSIGVRPVNNVVDITQFVMFEMGQPLHAYDLARLAAETGMPTLKVRRAHDGEVLRTLSDKTCVLSAQDLVVADATKPVALAGIIGSKESQVTSSTVTVLLEAAHFEPSIIRQSAKRHALKTDAQYRFERGTDIKALTRALDRAAHWLTEIAGGVVAKKILDCSAKNEPETEISLYLSHITHILGITLSAEQVVHLLDPLEIRCVGRMDSRLVFSPPSFRSDLTREIDLIEEIARRYGYDQIEPTFPDSFSEQPLKPITVVQDIPGKTRSYLLQAGFYETVHLSLDANAPVSFGVSPLPEIVPVLNPLTEETAGIRPQLMNHVLQSLARNMRMGLPNARIFEINRVCMAVNAEPEHAREETHCALALYGKRALGRWYDASAVDFLDIAGLLEGMATSWGLDVLLKLRPALVAGLEKNSAAVLWCGDIPIGFAGEVSPDIAQKWGIEQPVWIAEFSLSWTNKYKPIVLKHRPVSKYPKVRKDIGIIVGHNIMYAELENFILTHAGGELGSDVIEHVQLFDVYEGPSLGENERSLAFSIDYRKADRTLTDEEVNQAFSSLQNKLKTTLGVKIRDGG